MADFALDTFPVSGGTVTLHSLWIGLPSVTLGGAGQTGMNNSAASIFISAGDLSVRIRLPDEDSAAFLAAEIRELLRSPVNLAPTAKKSVKERLDELDDLKDRLTDAQYEKAKDRIIMDI